MDEGKNFNVISDFIFKTVIISYFIFLTLLILIITLDYLNFTMPYEQTLLKYSELIVTTVLVVVTTKYALDNNRMVQQNGDAQKIKFLQRRLELLYYPLQNIFTDFWYDIDYWFEHLAPDSEYLDDTELIDILSKLESNMANFLKYLYLGSEQLQLELKDVQKWFYDDRDMVVGNIKLLEDCYCQRQFFELCNEIKKTLESDIGDYMQNLNKIVK